MNYSTLVAECYGLLAALVPLQETNWQSLIFKAPGFQDLHVERLNKSMSFLGRLGFTISLAHYGESNGDLMADPDMELWVCHAGDGGPPVVMPLTFKQDYRGHFREFATYSPACNTITGISVNQVRSATEFLHLWLINIRDQGHKLAERE
jgi:hypothetical protein